MNKKTLIINNKNEITVFVILLSILLTMTTIVPIIFIKYFTLSMYAMFFMDNIVCILIIASILIYYLINQYYYSIIIDNYSIQITSYRVLSKLFKKQKNIDLNHSMLESYVFSNKKYSCNNTIHLKIKTNSGKKFVRKFSLSLISKKNINKISKYLDFICIKK